MASIVTGVASKIMHLASEFHIQEREFLNGMVVRRDVRIRKMGQISGPDKWAIYVSQGFALLKNGELANEPIPSSRTDEYLELSRYNTLDEAYKHFLNHKDKCGGPLVLFDIDDIID